MNYASLKIITDIDIMLYVFLQMHNQVLSVTYSVIVHP